MPTRPTRPYVPIAPIKIGRKERMKDPYDEGIANHIGPESCVGTREGVHEALTGGRAGRAIEPRNGDLRGADVVGRTEGNTGGTASARNRWTSRGRRPRARSDRFLHENREVPRLTAVDGDTVRAVNPMGAMRR
jgi:hypothetical protein